MKTGIYIPLFWCDRFPQYEEWAHELCEHIRDAADVTLLVTDGTLTRPRPDYTLEARVDKDAKPLLRACFERAVSYFHDADVTAFYYIGADNMHEKKEVERLLKHCTNGCDVAFSTFDTTWDRYDKVTFPPKPDPRFRFSYEGHTWPDSACFRTRLFTQRPLAEDPREFIRLTLKDLHDSAGWDVRAVYDPQVGFYYFQHGNNKLDRSFIQGD